MTKDLMIHFSLVYAMSRPKAALRTGALKPRISKRFPLDRIADAHELLGTGGARGKVLLDVA